MKATAPDWLNIDLPFECEIHTHRFLNDLSSTKHKVYVDTWEPRSSCESVQTVIDNAKKFDLILTIDEELSKLPNAKLFVGGSSWVYPWVPDKKDFSVSFLCTSNNYLPGYSIRHRLWSNQNRIYKIPKKFWSSKWRPVNINRVIPDRKDGLNEKVELFYSMFSICPENTSQKNYFTEKILDCFATKTVPVYWGCPNISEYFDHRGIVIFNDLDDLFEKVNSLTEQTYYDMLPYIETNYQNVKKYCDPSGPDRLRNCILDYFKATT